MFEESALEKIFAEEKRRQELYRDLIDPPWKRMMESYVGTEDKLQEQIAFWSSRCDSLNALGKSVVERVKMMDSAIQGGIDQIVSTAREFDRRASEAFSPLKDMIDKTVLGADSAMDKLRAFDEKLRIPLQFEFSISPDMENAVANLSKLFEVGRSIADNYETLYEKMSANEIGLYGNLWEKNVSPAFANDAVGFMTDFIGEVEEDEPEDALSVVRETVEYLNEHGKEFPLVSPKQAALIGMALCQFLYVIEYISKGMKAGTLAPESGSIQIVWLYFTLIYTICELKKKE